MLNRFFQNKFFLAILTITVILGATHQIIFSKIHVKEVPKLLTTLRAKEFCSCYFLLDKGKDYCLESVKKGYPLFDYEISDDKRLVTFKNALATSSAQVKELRFGCSLID